MEAVLTSGGALCDFRGDGIGSLNVQCPMSLEELKSKVIKIGDMFGSKRAGESRSLYLVLTNGNYFSPTGYCRQIVILEDVAAAER